MNNIANTNQERFKQYVVPILEILRELDIKFWLDFGTLLGVVREKVIMDHDHDIDISVLDSDREKLILVRDLLQAKGFKVVFQKNLHWFEDLMQIYLPRDEVSTDSKGRIKEGVDHFDIHIYTLIGDMLCMRRLHKPADSNRLGIMYYKLFRMINKSELRYSDTKVSLRNKPIMFIINVLPDKAKIIISKLVWELYIMRAKSSWLVVPYKFFSEFTSVTLYGHKFEMPKQYEKYLEYWYSEKWRIPDASFVTDTDFGGVVHKRIRNHKFTHISVETISNFEKYLWE